MLRQPPCHEKLVPQPPAYHWTLGRQRPYRTTTEPSRHSASYPAFRNARTISWRTSQPDRIWVRQPSMMIVPADE